MLRGQLGQRVSNRDTSRTGAWKTTTQVKERSLFLGKPLLDFGAAGAATSFREDGSGPRCSVLEAARRASAPQSGSRQARGPESAAGRDAHADSSPVMLAHEAHKHFDQVNITVRAGDGGNGAMLRMPRAATPGPAAHRRAETRGGPKTRAGAGGPRKGLKREQDGSLVLPMGGHGGDVVLYADEHVDTLLGLHAQGRHAARRGGNVDASQGLARRAGDGSVAGPLRIPVPAGTIVKRKRGGKLLADLECPGDEVLVARGGRGGISILAAPPRAQLRPHNVPDGATVPAEPEDKDLTQGLPGEEVTLELTLRVVADVGLVGLPNAGKSSLLAAATAAKPAVADYPFTTLMPNLGRMAGDPGAPDGGLAMGATVADLPGLIEGAHLGRGLGRRFLRHLRRTHVLVHLVDAAAADPLSDYCVLREELRMYNPEYIRRPHIVVLNKIDLPQAAEQWQGLRERLRDLRLPVGDQSTPLGPPHPTATLLPPPTQYPRLRAGHQGEESQAGGQVRRDADAAGRPRDILGLTVNKRTDNPAGQGGGRLGVREEAMASARGVSPSAQEGPGAVAGPTAAEGGVHGGPRARGGGEAGGGAGVALGGDSQMDQLGRGAQIQHGLKMGLGTATQETRQGSIGADSSKDGALAPPPVAVVGLSAKEGTGLEELLGVIRETIAKESRQRRQTPSGSNRLERVKSPQWQI